MASAPAKVILLGEHAVVYGQPAIAMPISSLRAAAKVTLEAREDGVLRIFSGEANIPITDTPTINAVENALAIAARLAAEKLGVALSGAVITIHSDIPVASGLGSGAAVTTAIIRAVAEATGKVLSDEETNALVYEVERIFHGTPSGIDNTVIVYERPIYFVRAQPFEPIRPHQPLHILIGDTGVRASTKHAVGDVRRLLETQPERFQPVIAAIGDLVRQARDCIEHGPIEQLGRLMVRNHDLLQMLTVSSPKLDRLVHAALNAGALGAKLSGGGRGGNMIALVTPSTRSAVETCLRRSGAVAVYYTVLNPSAEDDSTSEQR
ncbi:MAG: mevalonate kinase [Anaerolinea sp.]|nr:mevalonate kinase [Anaerolinea sp.]